MKDNNKPYKLQRTSDTNMLPGNPKGLPDESFYSEDTLVFIDEAFLFQTGMEIKKLGVKDN